MDNNIKTNDIRNIKAVIVDDFYDKNVTSIDCITELFIEYNNAKSELVSVDINDIEGRKELTRLFFRCLSDSKLHINKPNGVIKDSNNIQLYKLSDKAKLQEYAYVAYANNTATKKTYKAGKIALGAATIGLAATIGGCALLNNNKEEPVEEIEQTQEDNNEIVKPDMEGQEWDYYVANAIDNAQSRAWTTTGEFLLSFNNSQEWMERTNNNGDFSRFGFTPEEAMAFYLRFNNFTDEELITICNGNNINADEIMSLSNDFIEKMQIYYSVSAKSSGISMLFNDEHDKEVIESFEQQWTKVMSAEGKEKETLMKELKEMFKDYFNNDIEGKETKARQASTSYLLRTMLPVAQKLSDVNNYKDTMSIYKTGSGEAIDVKVDLFDEVFMSRYVQGFENFDEEHFLKQLGYNPDKYYVGIDGTKSSIADLSCGEQEQKFRDADEYRINLETSEQVIEDNKKALEAELKVYVDEDGKIDADKVAEALDNLELNSENATLAELTKYSYDPSLIADMLTRKLESLNKYPMNANTFHEYLIELLSKELLNNSKVSTTTTTKTEGKTLANTNNRQTAKDALIAAGDTPEVAEKKIIAAEEQAAKAVGAERDTEEIKKNHEEQAKKDMVNKQEVYDKTFNYYANGGTGEYRTDWANSSDANVREVYALGKQDGINNYEIKKQVEKENAENAKPTATPNVPDYVIPGSVTTDPSGNEGTVEDVINKSNSEDSNKDVVIPQPVPDPLPTTPPAPESTPEPTTPSDYSPIVDTPSDTIPSGPIYWDEDQILEQFSLENIEETSYSTDFQAMDEAASDLTEEESVQKTL